MFNRRLLKPFDVSEASKFSNGNAKPFCLSARNATKNSPAELHVYDVVGETYDGEGITAKDTAAFCAANRGKPINVLINSPGGLVFEGLAVFNALIQHDAQVSTVVTGIAASIASIILQAGNTRSAHENSNIMIHKAQGGCFGNSDEMIDCAKWLTKMDGQLAKIYTDRTGKSQTTMLNLMAGERDGTLFTADEAKNIGLIDSIIPNSGTRNSSPRNPSNIDDRIKQIRDKAHASQMSAAAKRRVRELSHS